MSKYFVRGREVDYIEDNIEIEKEKINNLRHSIYGFMLGDFDELGVYHVEDEIKEELIEMPKYITETIDNIDICQSVLKLNRHISFMVTFQSDCATLSLVEKINYESNFKPNTGVYSNVNEYILDRIETSGEIDKNYIYQKWNISKEPADEIDILTCGEEVLEKYFGIVNRFKYLLIANNNLYNAEQQMEEIETEYAMGLMDTLKSYPGLEKLVNEQLSKELNEKKEFLCIDKPNFSKTLNEILDRIIIKNKDALTEAEWQLFYKDKLALINIANIKRRDFIEMIRVTNATEFADLRLMVGDIQFARSISELMADYIATRKNLDNKINPSTEKVADRLEKLGVKKENITSRTYLEQHSQTENVKANAPANNLVVKAGETNKKNAGADNARTGGKSSGKSAGKSAGKPGGKTGQKPGAKTTTKDTKKTTVKPDPKEEGKKKEEERKKLLISGRRRKKTGSEVVVSMTPRGTIDKYGLDSTSKRRVVPVETETKVAGRVDTEDADVLVEM